MSKPKVLLLDGDTVQTLSVARSLKAINASVTIFCAHKLSYGYWSKFPDRKILIPMNYTDISFLNFILDFLKADYHDIIIPMFDDGASFLSINKSSIEALNVKVAVPEYQRFILAQNKGNLMEFCQINNIPHPKTRQLTSDNLQIAAEEIGFPSLLKPDISSGAKGIATIHNFEELKSKYYDALIRFGALSLQEYINNSGSYFNAMLYRSGNGIFSEVVIIEIKRYFPIKGGTSSFCCTVKNKEIEDICKSLLQQLGYVGFADFDLIKDTKSGEIKLLEINPRMPSSIHAAYISGINFPEIIVTDLLYEKMSPKEFKLGCNLRYLAMDIMWFIFNKNRFSSIPNWFNFFQRNTFYQDGSFKDPLPFFSGILMGLIKYSRLSYIKSKLKD